MDGWHIAPDRRKRGDELLRSEKEETKIEPTGSLGGVAKNTLTNKQLNTESIWRM